MYSKLNKSLTLKNIPNMAITNNIDLGIREIRSVTTFIRERHGRDYSEFALTAFKRRVEAFLAANKYGVEVLLKNLDSIDFLDHFAAKVAVSETEMFRDPTYWILLKNNYISSIIKERGRLRVWLPMCASGEEYYSLVILLKENGWLEKAEITVTSISNESLEAIQRGFMEHEKLEISTKNHGRFQSPVPFTNYYKAVGNTVNFEKSLFVNTKFIKDDIISKNDFGHVDLVLFRNKMIYFTSSLQSKVIEMLHSKMAVKGFLTLGILEEIDTLNKFAPIDKKESIYQRKS